MGLMGFILKKVIPGRKRIEMEIGGCDIIIESKIPIAPNLVQLIIQDHWPKMVVELDEGDDFFAYKDELAKIAWDAQLADCCYDADMIYVLFREDHKQVTFVIDGDKKLQYIIDDITQFIRNCEPDEATNI